MSDLMTSIAAGQAARARGAEAGLEDAIAAVEIYKKKLAALEERLSGELAHSAGLEAQLNAMKEAHPQSPLLLPSGKVYRRSGNVKTRGRIVYEAAFDRIAAERRIDPMKHRAD